MVDRDVRVGISTLDQLVIRLHPLILGHDSIVVDKCLSDVAFTLGVVPVSTHKSIVPVVLTMLPLVDEAVVVDVTKSVLVADIGLKAHIVIDEVVKTVEIWQAKFQVFARVPIIIAYKTIFGEGSASTASQVVKDFIVEYILIERSQISLNIDWVILCSVVLLKLLKTDLLIVIQVHHLEDSYIFCSVSASQT